MSGSQYPSDVQFAGLIQAATAAAVAHEHSAPAVSTASVLGKRDRRDDNDDLIDVQLRARPIERQPTTGQLPPSTPILQSSAAVLFREPSEKSKKYSRPPLGKVFTELELAPESFLRLQNAAKMYMLDDEHPERRDVVGHKKHSSNNDVAKLRLWGCVEDFLTHEDNAEKWFGHSAGVGIPDSPQRTFFWPEDRHKIIKKCMPLFRKMVTNERQRLYASETRKQDSNKSEKNGMVETTTPQAVQHSPLPQWPVDESSLVGQSLETDNANQVASSAGEQQRQLTTSTGSLILHINLIANEGGESRRVSKFSASSDSIRDLSGLIAEARKRYDFGLPANSSSKGDWFMPVVKVWLTNGLVRIKDDEQWMVALLSASMVEWMDSEVRILIEIGTNVEPIIVD